MEIIEFAETYTYDTMLVGITVPVALFDGAESSAFKAKIDTGSSFCILNAKMVNVLDSKSKAAKKSESARRPMILRLTDTN